MKLLRAREALGLSQEAAAMRFRVGVRTIRDIEAGRSRMTALELLLELEEAATALPLKRAA